MVITAYTYVYAFFLLLRMVHFFLAYVVTCIRKEMSFRCGKIRVARFLLLLLLFSTHHTDVLRIYLCTGL